MEDEEMEGGLQSRISGFRGDGNSVEMVPDHVVIGSLQSWGRVESVPEPTLDAVFEVLSNARRRWVCRYLRVYPEGCELGELSEYIAALENDVNERMVSSTERKRVYISLYQCHLPKMDAFGAVRFDPDRKTVRAGRDLGTYAEGLELIEDLLLPAGRR